MNRLACCGIVISMIFMSIVAITRCAPMKTTALHNAHTLRQGLVSGAVPDSDAAFDELVSMGIRTIISVDGATPDVARAEARGLRYVHIPTTYSEVSMDQQLEIGRAIRDLPGPIYLHCHHGKHRAPAALATTAVALGMISNAEAVEFMTEAGTAPSYAGLYACAREAEPIEPAAFDRASAEFPAIRMPQGLVAAMVEVDRAFEHLGEIRSAQWRVPAANPDLVPAAEAGRLVDILRASRHDQESRRLEDAYERELDVAIVRATTLEAHFVAGAAPDELERAYRNLRASCQECHAAFRDLPAAHRERIDLTLPGPLR